MIHRRRVAALWARVSVAGRAAERRRGMTDGFYAFLDR
jgi:hypothetical protein